MSNISKHIAPEAKAAARALGYAITLADEAAWHDFATVARTRLTEPERAALAFSALRAQPRDQARWTAAAAIDGTVHAAAISYLDTPAGREALLAWRDERDRRRRRVT